MPLATSTLPLTKEDIYYPETDGKPMADSDFQRKPLTYLIEALDYAFREQPNVYVSGDLLIYYEKGNPKASIAPDVFVIFDVPKQERRIYQTWVEGKPPDVVIEIASPSTFKKDEIEKSKLYQKLGVHEYFQYDPQAHYIKPALQGLRLDNQGQYQQIMGEKLIDGTLVLKSEALGMELHLSKGNLRVFEPKTNTHLFTYDEQADARKAAEKRLLRERKQKEWSQQEAKVEREKAEQERQQKEQALQQAEQERQQKEQALQQAEQERQEKDLALAKIQKMAEQLRALGVDSEEL